jgi:3-methyladenine DNA glycosylase AlkD
MLIEDHDEIVVRALSWALREFAVHDPIEVGKFTSSNDDLVAARVKREVRNKLETGLKNPDLRPRKWT